MPDLDVEIGGRQARVFELLHDARPVLLEFGGSTLDGGGHVRQLSASYDGRWVLPVIGEVAAPTAALVRPDGHVAWVGTGSTEGLNEALTTWCGAKTTKGQA
jgi:3-(3-hydroxy-phenyl)propionate hydroxylase